MRYELPKNRKHFATAIVPLSGSKIIEGKPIVNLNSGNYIDSALEFDSGFESGNLFSAYRVG